MPNIKSAVKRVRTNEENRLENLAYRTRTRSSRKKFLEAIEQGNAEAAKVTYAAFCSALDKAAKKGVIKKNTAVRGKRRGADRLRALAAQ